MNRKSYFNVVMVPLLLGSLVAFEGCKSEIDRHNLSGQVTFRGKPVRVGLIVFEPDVTKGNRGPQGYAQIIDGRYETEKFGKGAIVGALSVEITGFPPVDGSAGNPSIPLFPPYKTQVEITSETTTLDFTVPERR
ncbi:MAG TPA: hypothetical protein VJL29_01915 [Thermoguttaceae bacterium]|nr:hypothetical protein [Thermoguttaceae bacterium]